MDIADVQDLKPHHELPLDPRYAGLSDPYHTPVSRLLSSPYDEQPAVEGYAAAPPDELRHLEISCSS